MSNALFSHWQSVSALQARGPNNSVVFPDGVEVTLDELEPVHLFSPQAQCFDGENQIPCPEPAVFAKHLQDGSKVTVAKNGAGAIDKISKQKKNERKSQVLQAVDTDVFTYIPPEAIDSDFYSRFTMKEKAVDNLNNNINRQLRGVAKTQRSGRALQSTCTTFREIEVAIAVESSFCADIGVNNVDAAVQTIMEEVAKDYEQDGLCFTAKMTHYEKHCVADSDPYKPGVDLNLSGCGNYGL